MWGMIDAHTWHVKRTAPGKNGPGRPSADGALTPRRDKQLPAREEGAPITLALWSHGGEDVLRKQPLSLLVHATRSVVDARDHRHEVQLWEDQDFVATVA
jgi:hypothetical protein